MVRRKPMAMLATFIVAALLLSAAVACGGGGKKATPTPEPSVTPGGTPTATAAPLVDTIDLSTQSPSFTAYGADAADLSGGHQTVAAADFNGDDRLDFLIGAPQADGPDNDRQDAGEAYVIFGSDDAPDSLDLAQNEPDLKILGASPGDSLGRTALAADLNADGIDDVIVGAPGVTAEPDPRTDQGRVYVFFGSRNLKGTIDLAEGDSGFDFVVTGAEGFSRLGDALASGDVNGDDITDLVLGAPFAGREPGTRPGSPRKEAGEVYAIFGSADISGEVNIAFDAPDFQVSAEQRFGQLGAAVAVGDINGDGIDDVIAGAYQMDIGDKTDAGALYAFFGAKDLSGRRFIDKKEYDFAAIGADAGDALGIPLASADVNGDGVDDIVAGARTGDALENARPAGGEAYVMFGGDALGGELDLAAEQSDVTIYGPDNSYLVPTALSVADVNSDGEADIILTTSIGPRERLGAGAVYIVHGGVDLKGTADLASPPYRFALVGADPNDRLGAAMAAAPEDEATALLLVASDADGLDNKRADAGEVYLVSLPKEAQ